MVNTMQKMRRSNVKARAWLTQNGYKNINFFPHTRWQKDCWIDGLAFDGFCSSGIEICFFQVKSNGKPSKQTMVDYKDVGKKFGILCMWINSKDRQGVEVYF